MPTWIELDQQFRDLQPALQFHRLDYQWGAAGIYYRLGGVGINDSTRRFEALARIAGLKLSELPPGALHQNVWLREDPAERWYEALKHYSGAFEHDLAGSQHDADGTFRGHIYSGFIQSPLTASGVFALHLSATPVAPPAAVEPPNFWSRTNQWLKNEAKERGYLWLVGAAIAGLVLAAMAL